MNDIEEESSDGEEDLDLPNVRRKLDEKDVSAKIENLQVQK